MTGTSDIELKWFVTHLSIRACILSRVIGWQTGPFLRRSWNVRIFSLESFRISFRKESSSSSRGPVSGCWHPRGRTVGRSLYAIIQSTPSAIDPAWWPRVRASRVAALFRKNVKQAMCSKCLGAACYFFFFLFLWPCLQHMEVPPTKSGIRAAAEAYTTPRQYWILATSVTYATACGNSRSLTHWTRPGLEPISSEETSGL